MVARTEYAVILDAGSSGTRIYLYQWTTTTGHPVVSKVDGWSDPKLEPGLHELAPVIKAIPDNKVPVHLSHQIITYEPLSKTTADTVKRVATYLEPLIAQARQFLPQKRLNSTPLFLMATAGMRRLKKYHYQEFMILRGAVIDYLKTCGFAEAQYKTISGEDEGLYGWVATNYVDNRFAGGAQPHGFMEMGGESLQFAVSLQPADLDRYTGMLREVTIAGVKRQVFVKTWLGLGGDSAWKRHEERLRESESTIPHDPCLPNGYAYRLSGSDKIVVGKTEFPECLKETFSLLSCPDEECLGGNLCIYQSAALNPPGVARIAPGCLLKDPISGKPLMTFDTTQFDGASVYYHALHGIFGRIEGDNQLGRYWTAVGVLSAQSWEKISADRVGTPSIFVKRAFFTAAMVMSTLFYGFGIPMPQAAIDATKLIAVERATRAIATAELVKFGAYKNRKQAEAARERSVEGAKSARDAEDRVIAVTNAGDPWPTEAHAKACELIYQIRKSEANRKDMIATMAWETGKADSRAEAAEAARAARVKRVKASALATETYSESIKATCQLRDANRRSTAVAAVNLTPQPIGIVPVGTFQYNPGNNADWPLGRIVLYASGSDIVVRSKIGWMPPVGP